MALVVALVMVVSGALTLKILSPGSSGLQTLTDINWVEAADELCASSIPTLDAAVQRSGAKSQMQPASRQILQFSAGLDDVAHRLDELLATRGDRTSIKSWLGDWFNYTSLQRRYAAQLGATSPAGSATTLLASDRARHTANSFALANGLEPCRL